MARGADNGSWDLIVIGGGPAGIQASRMVKTARPEWKVAVIRPEPHSIVYCALPYAMEGLFPLERTFKKDELVTETGAELIRVHVQDVDIQTKELHLEDGRRLSYERLLVVSGAQPTRPPVPGVDGDNVFTVKMADDARRIMDRLAMSAECDTRHPSEGREGQRQIAVVIGSGAIGIEQAVAYASLDREVHLVEMRDHVLPHLLDADMAQPCAEELRRLGVRLHLDTPLEALEGVPSVHRVRLDGGTAIDLDPKQDFVVAAVGMKPTLGFLRDGDFEQSADGLLVDPSMRTSVPGVWAAGDCVSGWSGIDGEALGGKLATNAVPMAKVAARDILGQEASYAGFFNGAVTVVGNLRVGGTGFTETFAKARGMDVYATTAGTTARFPMMPDPGHVLVKLVFERGSDRLVGAQAVGTEAIAERIDLLTMAIQQRMTAPQLAQLSYSSQPWQTFFPARNAIVEAATAAVAVA